MKKKTNGKDEIILVNIFKFVNMNSVTSENRGLKLILRILIIPHQYRLPRLVIAWSGDLQQVVCGRL